MNLDRAMEALSATLPVSLLVAANRLLADRQREPYQRSHPNSHISQHDKHMMNKQPWILTSPVSNNSITTKSDTPGNKRRRPPGSDHRRWRTAKQASGFQRPDYQTHLLFNCCQTPISDILIGCAAVREAYQENCRTKTK